MWQIQLFSARNVITLNPVFVFALILLPALYWDFRFIWNSMRTHFKWIIPFFVVSVIYYRLSNLQAPSTNGIWNFKYFQNRCRRMPLGMLRTAAQCYAMLCYAMLYLYYANRYSTLVEKIIIINEMLNGMFNASSNYNSLEKLRKRCILFQLYFLLLILTNRCITFIWI